MKKLQDLLKDYDFDGKRYISREFQDYGIRLAHELHDTEHKSLYIKLAKELPRGMLEDARAFVKDQTSGAVRSKAKLFMWKLKELKKEKKVREEAEREQDIGEQEELDL